MQKENDYVRKAESWVSWVYFFGNDCAVRSADLENPFHRTKHRMTRWGHIPTVNSCKFFRKPYQIHDGIFDKFTVIYDEYQPTREVTPRGHFQSTEQQMCAEIILLCVLVTFGIFCPATVIKFNSVTHYCF